MFERSRERSRERLAAARPTVRLPAVAYLGGHDRQRKKYPIVVVLHAEDTVRWSGVSIPWADVASIEAMSGDETSRITATRAALIGPFAIAFRKRKTGSLLVLSLHDGREVLFDVPDMQSVALRGKLAALQQYLT